MRTYNSHLSRVEVITYDDLLDTAERALRFEEEYLSDIGPANPFDGNESDADR